MKKYLLPNTGNYYKANLHCHTTLSDGKHKITFDHIVEVMHDTGHDLPVLYKETSTGGIAKIELKKKK